MTDRDPRNPTPDQVLSEARLRGLGVTVTFDPAPGVPHEHAEPVPGCFRCVLAESARRVNGAPT